MNAKRFVARSAREALSQARATWGDNAVVLSNREIPGGVEIVAMAHAEVAAPNAPASAPSAAPPRRQAPVMPEEPMSTVSFEQYVRERQRRQIPLGPLAPLEPGRFAAEELQRASDDAAAAATAAASAAPVTYAIPPIPATPATPAPLATSATPATLAPLAKAPAPAIPPAAAPITAPIPAAPIPPAADAAPAATQRVLDELRELRESLGGQLARMTWFDNARRKPVHTRLLRDLLDAGFTPGLARYLVDKLPPHLDDAQAGQWLAQVLQGNLRCAQEGGEPLALRGGALAVVGPCGSGKTLACAALAHAHAAFYGPASVGLIAFEAWPDRAGESLRTVARALGMTVHTARDRESLVDMLSLLEGRSLVLVDTPGLAARDPRRQDLGECLPPALERLLVLPATWQPESLDEAVQAWAAETSSDTPAGCVFTRMDEAHRLGPVIDLAVRRKLRLEGLVQRVGEAGIWAPPDAAALVGRALAPPANPLFTLAEEDLGLVMTPPLSLRADHAL